MHVFKKLWCALFPWISVGFIALGVVQPLPSQAQSKWCRCPGGAIFEAGLVNYKGNSEREIVTRIEVQEGDPELRCGAAWIGLSEVYAKGTPYSFHLQRRSLRTVREDGCGDSPDQFASRIKTYGFVLDADSQPIREMGSTVDESTSQQLASKPGAESNANVWSSISTDTPAEPPRARPPARHDVSAPEFCRTAWVLARRDTQGHYVGLTRGIDQRETILALSKTRTIRAGELGQIEASNGRTAIVRFYSGGRVGNFSSHKTNALRRWYDDVGGPYTEMKDDLYTPLRARILEVPLDDIIEVNDYLDQQKTGSR
jgi:hypothetical protein